MDTLLKAERLERRHDGRAIVEAASLTVRRGEAVALARALINRPALVLADEPTGSLDSRSAGLVLEALEEIRSDGTALLMSTHDSKVAAHLGRTVRMHDGRIVEDSGV